MRPRPLNPRNYVVAVIIFFVIAVIMALAPLMVQVKIQIRSHRQPVIKISNSDRGTIVEDKEVIYYHKNRR